MSQGLDMADDTRDCCFQLSQTLSVGPISALPLHCSHKQKSRGWSRASEAACERRHHWTSVVPLTHLEPWQGSTGREEQCSVSLEPLLVDVCTLGFRALPKLPSSQLIRIRFHCCGPSRLFLKDFGLQSLLPLFGRLLCSQLKTC